MHLSNLSIHPSIYLSIYLPRETTSQLPKAVRTWFVLYILTSKMCFAPQQRAFFRHHNFQKRSERGVFCTFWLQNVLRATTACTFSTSELPKWSENGVFCTFWLGNVLRATTACAFSTSQLPKVVRRWCALYILTWKCASRHNGVQLFISHLSTWLRTRRFSEPTLRPSGATNPWKNTAFRDIPTFSRTWIFFLLTLSLLWSSLFDSSLLWLFPYLLFICIYGLLWTVMIHISRCVNHPICRCLTHHLYDFHGTTLYRYLHLWRVVCAPKKTKLYHLTPIPPKFWDFDVAQ